MTEQQVVHESLHSTDRIRHLLFGILGGLLQANQAPVHAHRVIAHHVAKRLVNREFYLRVECIVCRFIGLRLLLGIARHALARHDFLVHAAKIRRELGIACIEFAGRGLVFLGQLRFGIALTPVFRLEFLERVRLLQADAGKRLHLALQAAHFFHLQGILDARLVLGGRLLFARRPRPCKR